MKDVYLGRTGSYLPTSRYRPLLPLYPICPKYDENWQIPPDIVSACMCRPPLCGPETDVFTHLHSPLSPSQQTQTPFIYIQQYILRPTLQLQCAG